MNVTIAFNEGTSLYEVHAEGCKHLGSKRLEAMVTVPDAVPAEAAATFEARNEDCVTKISPCANKLRLQEVADRLHALDDEREALLAERKALLPQVLGVKAEVIR